MTSQEQQQQTSLDAVQKDEHLIEPESTLTRAFSWYWPTSERETLEAERLLLSCVTIPINRS